MMRWVLPLALLVATGCASMETFDGAFGPYSCRVVATTERKNPHADHPIVYVTADKRSRENAEFDRVTATYDREKRDVIFAGYEPGNNASAEKTGRASEIAVNCVAETLRGTHLDINR